MRKRVGVVIIAVGLLLNGCAGLQSRILETSAGRVTALKGEALVIRPGENEPQSLDLDSKVFPRDVVRTLENSRCRITLTDNTILALGERSELEIQDASSPLGTRRIILKVAVGLLRLVGLAVPGAGIAVEVITGVASFFFLGTEAIIEVTPGGTAALSLEGSVRVVSRQEGIPGEVVLRPGEGTDIAAGKPPTPPRLWPAPRVERVKQATSLP
ncbi:MAG: FecR domain-containing protein [Nitrospinae bacterium]|nr:FecR domain-containing protein [Nitrospinota bacterium]